VPTKPILSAPRRTQDPLTPFHHQGGEPQHHQSRQWPTPKPGVRHPSTGFFTTDHKNVGNRECVQGGTSLRSHPIESGGPGGTPGGRVDEKRDSLPGRHRGARVLPWILPMIWSDRVRTGETRGGIGFWTDVLTW